jgi:uncharacterized integral membrane protein
MFAGDARGTIARALRFCRSQQHEEESGHAFYAAVAYRSARPNHSALGVVHASFLKRFLANRIERNSASAYPGRMNMDELDWVIIVVGAFIALVVAVSAYENEKRLERIIKLLERERP